MKAATVTVLRIPGFIAASLFVLVAILGNTLASEEADFKSPSEVLLWRLGALGFALPLMLPWRIVSGPLAWRVLIGWLWVDALGLTYYEIDKLVWFFRNRPFDIWLTYILPLSLLLIAGVWMALVAAVTARKDRV
jgi:hypothetical protein